MKRGDKLIVHIAGQRIQGTVQLASPNGKSLAVDCRHSVPPLAIDRRTGLVQLLFLKQDDGTWLEIISNRPVTIEEVKA